MKRLLARAAAWVLRWCLRHHPKEEAAAAASSLLQVPLYQDPVQAIVSLRDDPDAAYVWILRDAYANDKAREDFSGLLSRIYTQHRARDPRALHIVVHEVTEVRAFTSRDVRRLLAPVLTDQT